MAYPPEVKARVKVDLAKGLSIAQAAKKNRVGKTAVGEWAKEIRTATGQSSVEAKESAFAKAVERFGVAALDMLEAQAVLLKDPSYLKNQSTTDVVAHTRFIRDSLIGFINLERNLGAPAALPERAEIVRAELVDEPA